MCNPALIAIGVGTAASLAGNTLQAREQAKFRREANEANEAAALEEMRRQQAFQQEAGQTFADTLGAFEQPAQAEALDAEAAHREQRFQANEGVPQSANISTSAPRVVKAEIAKRMAEALERGRQQAAAQAKIGARGDVAFGNQLALQQGGQNLGDLSSISRGSLGLLPAEQQARINSLDGPSGIGDLIAGAGSIGVNAGLSGALPGPQADPTMAQLQQRTKGYRGGYGF